MNLTVRIGYKQSKVGEIPEIWNCLTVQELIDKGAIVGHLDGNHGELYPRSHEFKNFGVPYIGANNFYSGQVDLQGCKFLSEERAAIFKKGVAKDGDVLFAHNATVGPVAKLKTSLRCVILSTTATYFRVNGSLLNSDYLMHYMRSELFSSQYSAIMSQSTRNQVPITAQRKLAVVIPPIDEQSSIASSLSVVDDLIFSLDQLISKKRNILQAAMQQLLTGQRRLPGFSGEWITTTFGDIVKHHSGNSTLIKGSLSSESKHGLYAAYSASGQDVWHTTYEHEGEAIIISAVGSRCGKAFRAFGKWSAIANTHVVWPIEGKVNSEFLHLYINDESFWLKSGSGQPFVLFKQSFARKLSLPPLDEQAAVASTLFDMASDIAALEARCDKALQVKQGMMHELLTGRIRLMHGNSE